MKPKVLEQTMSVSSNVISGNLAAFANTVGSELKDTGLTIEQVQRIVDMTTELAAHLIAESNHVSDEDRARWDKRESVVEHAGNQIVHVSLVDRERWDEKETPEGAQAKVNEVMTFLNAHQYNNEIHVTQYEKNRLENVYTKEEVELLISRLMTNTVWKESVNTYEDIFTTYPDPYDGWTVNVLDSDLTYKFDGIDWICISANVIPLATEEVDGKMSKEDKRKLDAIASGANNYTHPNDPYTRHVTDDQIQYWSAKADYILASYDADGLMTRDDKVKLDGIEEKANYYEHPSTHSARIIEQTDDLQFVSKNDKDYWSSKAPDRLVTQYIDGMMSKEDKIKLDNISAKANLYVHPTKHDPTIIEETEDKQFVSGQDKITWNAKFGRANFIRGSAVFNGAAGTKIVHSLNDTATLYSVIVTPTSGVTPEKIGHIYVVKDPNAIFVYSTGGDIADSFDYLIIEQ